MNRLLPPRRIIPQWQKANFAIHQADMLGLIKSAAKTEPFVSDPDIVNQAIASWKNSESVGELADLLSFGVDPSLHGLLIAPAKATIQSAGASVAMKMVAEEILRSGGSQAAVWSGKKLESSVQEIRSLLKLAPTDTIALIDLAQHHLTNGKTKAAYRCLITALQVSPNSVFATRAMARYWIHLEMPDRAHQFIKSSKLTPHDPWLMASEIAIAQVAKSPSTQLRRAQRAIAIKSFSPRDLSELAAAVGGTELSSGNLKEARKLFRAALDRPNHNVLAQAINNQTYLGIEIDEQVLRRAPNEASEGRAYKAIVEGDFEAAAKFTFNWGASEPFSSRPKLLESYVNGALGEYQVALTAAEDGLRADPNDLTLRGNKAYALAGLLQFEAAEAELRVISAKDNDYLGAFSLATKGMIATLSGESASGIALYEKALAEFKKKGDEESVTTCYAFMARAATITKIPEAPQIVQRANDRFSKSPSPAASVVLRTLNQVVANLPVPSLRKVTQWEWDAKTNTLMEKRLLTRKGAPRVVVKSNN